MPLAAPTWRDWSGQRIPSLLSLAGARREICHHTPNGRHAVIRPGELSRLPGPDQVRFASPGAVCVTVTEPSPLDCFRGGFAKGGTGTSSALGNTMYACMYSCRSSSGACSRRTK